MKDELPYSFDDEPVSKFCYDLDNKKIEVHFTAYYDCIKDIYIESPCVWTIENWEYAKSTLGNEEKRGDLEDHIRIFSLILYMQYNDHKELEMGILTINDDRYITLFFKNPQLSLKEINSV